MGHAFFHWTITEPLIRATLYTVVVWNSRCLYKMSASQIMAKQRYITYKQNY